MNKKLCYTHHYYYNGVECPLCLKERISHMNEKYGITVNTKDDNPLSDITDSMLDKLKEKFNSH